MLVGWLELELWLHFGNSFSVVQHLIQPGLDEVVQLSVLLLYRLLVCGVFWCRGVSSGGELTEGLRGDVVGGLQRTGGGDERWRGSLEVSFGRVEAG